MASRSKKKRNAAEQAPVATAAPLKAQPTRSAPGIWVWVMLIAIIASFAFSFIASYDVQATVDLDLGDSTTELFEEDDFHIGAAMLDIIFAPLGGYEGAAHWLVQNFPATADSETMQQLAEAYMDSYPEQLLAQLDAAFIAIYVIEVAIVVVTALYLVGFIVLVCAKGINGHLAAIVMTAVVTFVALVRMVFAIAVYSQSTKEFVLTAGGGAWLTFVAFATALVVLVASYIGKRKKEALS